MPNIKGIDLSDGVKIIPGEYLWEQDILAHPGNNPHYTQAYLLEYYATHTIEECEIAATNWLNYRLEKWGVKVEIHIYPTDLPTATCICTDLYNEIPDNWWE